MEDDVLSLRNHLMNWLLTPLFVLWLFSTVAGYVATLNYANQPYDLALLERAQSVAEQMRLGTGQERLDFRPPLPDGRDPNMPDRVFYTVSNKEGRMIAGNADLARPLAYRGGKSGPLFSNGEREGEKTRVVSLVYPGTAGTGLFQLHMSETIHQRQALIRGIFANIVIPQLLLIVIAVGAVWYALKRGLAPLERLRREVAKRPRDDLSLLDEARAPDEVRPLIRAVNDLLERLKQVMAVQQRFVADAAHQLRTPFAGLKTQAELALRETDPERVRHALTQILTSAERCNHLVNQLLALARNEPGSHAYGSFDQLDLNRLAQDVTMQWVPEALKKNIDLGFEGSSQALPVRGDTIGLKEMIGNLLDNAIRYTPSGGAVTLRVGYEKGGAVLRIEDNGPGIPEEHREHVFDRFYRILGSGQPGSGLGLAIVQEVARLHSAHVSLSASTNGRGTLITVRFPHHSTA